MCMFGEGKLFNCVTQESPGMHPSVSKGEKVEEIHSYFIPQVRSDFFQQKKCNIPLASFQCGECWRQQRMKQDYRHRAKEGEGSCGQPAFCRSFRKTNLWKKLVDGNRKIKLKISCKWNKRLSSFILYKDIWRESWQHLHQETSRSDRVRHSSLWLSDYRRTCVPWEGANENRYQSSKIQ